MWLSFIKNGIYIHFVHPIIQYLTGNMYLSSAITVKLYSINYFYWYGHVYTYLPNKKYNWIKQFVRFTDTGHIAAFMIIWYPNTTAIAHNIQFIIMVGYWAGKIIFNLKDADRIGNDPNNPETCDIIDLHTDFCTYIHHTIPYIVVVAKINSLVAIQPDFCTQSFDNTNLINTYLWLYLWLIIIYVPWRLFTKDPVYSILDQNQTPNIIIAAFIGFIHLLIFASNIVGYQVCNIKLKI